MNNKLLKDIVCPIGKKVLQSESGYLVCTYCGVKFPVREDIPVLLIEEAVLPDGIYSIEDLICMNI